MSVAVNFGRAGIYSEEFPSTKSPDPYITWFCKVTYNIIAVVSLVPQGLCSLNLARW